ncbi:DUF5333 domain-containing protein [Roseovarius sp.]|uniref:DUF5333 domain-containing protein n=1 Tax=Roseovarius sp. TaxID=1486281 RepID=UPI003BAB0C2C
MKRMTALVLSLALSAGAVGASAGAGLENERDINDGLLALAVADKIRRECNSIGGKYFKAQSYANGLKSLAAARGYSDAQIDAYINDDVEKEKMRQRRNAYFEARGASNLDAESLCVLGRAEMAQKSRIGQLLRAK